MTTHWKGLVKVTLAKLTLKRHQVNNVNHYMPLLSASFNTTCWKFHEEADCPGSNGQASPPEKFTSDIFSTFTSDSCTYCSYPSGWNKVWDVKSQDTGHLRSIITTVNVKWFSKCELLPTAIRLNQVSKVHKRNKNHPYQIKELNSLGFFFFWLASCHSLQLILQHTFLST